VTYLLKVLEVFGIGYAVWATVWFSLSWYKDERINSIGGIIVLTVWCCCVGFFVTMVRALVS